MGVKTIGRFAYDSFTPAAVPANGNAVPGAHAIDTVATAGDDVSQAFHAIVTAPKNAPTATLNFKSANAASVRVANVIVVKVA